MLGKKPQITLMSYPRNAHNSCQTVFENWYGPVVCFPFFPFPYRSFYHGFCVPILAVDVCPGDEQTTQQALSFGLLDHEEATRGEDSRHPGL